MLAGYIMQSKLTSLSEITDNNVSCEIKDQNTNFTTAIFLSS